MTTWDKESTQKPDVKKVDLVVLEMKEKAKVE